MVFRHGIVAEDGNREGKRTPKIAEENVARFIDVLRWWASVNDQAQVVRRVPWKEIYEFTNTRAAWMMPAPFNSEQLKERIKTVAASVGKRREMNFETPKELVALFGGPVAEAPEWVGEFSWMEFPFVLFQIAYTTSVVVRMVGIDGRALARDYSLRPVLG
jgi:hypothetical protein